MVRNYQRKTGRAKMPKENIETALQAFKSGMSIRKIATLNDINDCTLIQYIKLMKGRESLADVYLGSKPTRRFLNAAFEINVVQYILKAAAFLWHYYAGAEVFGLQIGH